MAHRHVSLLTKLPAFNEKDDCLSAVIETPKGSSNKYDYDAKHGHFELAKTLPEGLAFPFDFGFIPSTKGEDGDPLDVLVLMDFPAEMGCVVNVRLIGCIEAEQTEKGGKAVRNDRLIAISRDSRTRSDVEALTDLRSGLLDEIKQFFVQYNKLGGKKFKPIGDRGVERALALVKAGVKKAGKKH
jgi:inorganic pyrophosphatase